jgi:hypothetical protein
MRPDGLGSATMAARKMPLAINIGKKANPVSLNFSY